MKIIILFGIFLLLFSSCTKDYTCVCELTKTTEAIFYNNKIETAETTSSSYSYESITGKEKDVKTECSNLNSTNTEENTNLPEGRTGGAITHETTCSIQ